MTTEKAQESLATCDAPVVWGRQLGEQVGRAEICTKTGGSTDNFSEILLRAGVWKCSQGDCGTRKGFLKIKNSRACLYCNKNDPKRGND